jgi:hypothetical protein
MLKAMTRSNLNFTGYAATNPLPFNRQPVTGNDDDDQSGQTVIVD